MTRQNKTQDTVEMISLFGIEIENKKYDTKALVSLLKDKFDELETIGHISYFVQAMKQAKLVDESYAMIAAIINKLFELNGLQTKTTDKCQAWYANKLRKGKINPAEPFRAGRKKQEITSEQIDSLFV